MTQVTTLALNTGIHNLATLQAVVKDVGGNLFLTTTDINLFFRVDWGTKEVSPVVTTLVNGNSLGGELHD